MKIKAVVCDIDGTLMPPDAGIFVDERVKEALLALQETGVMVILASARIFQGVYPLAKQIQMDHYGGYIISSNGAYGYDMKQQKECFIHGIQKHDALMLHELFLTAGLDFAIAQSDRMIASGFSKGFALDHFNCDVDYLLSDHPQQHIHTEITKCSASGEAEEIDLVFSDLKTKIESKYPYRVIRSTPYFIDIIAKECGKAQALKEISFFVKFPLEAIAAIGDGDSDGDIIQQCGLGVTLQNGSDLCKKNADLIVGDYEHFGCLEFFAYLQQQNK